MSDATVLPTASQLRFFYYADKPKLDVGLTADSADDTIYVTVAPRDRDGAIITGSFLISVTNKAGKTERIWVPARTTDGSGNVVTGVSTDGLSFLGCIRGIDPNGLDYTVGDTDFILALDGGSRVNCVIAAQSGELLRAAIQGLIATGGSGLILGTDAAGTVTIYRSTGVGTYVGWIRFNIGNGKVEYSNNGSAWNTFDSVTASNLVVVTNSDTTPGNFYDKSASGTGITRTVLNPGANEQLQFSVNGTLAALISDVTATATEINQAIHNIGASVTAAALTILTNGSNADAYHVHSSPKVNITAAEAINGSASSVPVALLGNSYKNLLFINATGRTLFSTAAGAALAVGDVDARTRQAQSFARTDALATTITLESLTTLLEIVGAPADNIYIEVCSDSAGVPGSVITNGTSNVISGGSLSTTMVPAKFTWATPPTLVSGTTYWFVVRRSGANDAANYYRLRTAGADVYSTFNAASYTASTTAWSTTSTDIQLFAQFNYNYGGKVCYADADAFPRANVYGFTSSNVAGSANAAVGVIGLMAGFSGLTPGAYYWLSTTQGQITITPPSLGTTFNAGNSRFCVARALTTDTVEVLHDAEHLLSITDVYTSGNPMVETGAATATVDLFIETGFKPKKFVIRYMQNDVAGAATDDRFNISDFAITDQDTMFRIISPSLTLNGATSTIDATDSDYVTVAGVYDNGYLLRIKQKHGSESMSSLTVLATT